MYEHNNEFKRNNNYNFPLRSLDFSLLIAESNWVFEQNDIKDAQIDTLTLHVKSGPVLGPSPAGNSHQMKKKKKLFADRQLVTHTREKFRL